MQETSPDVIRDCRNGVKLAYGRYDGRSVGMEESMRKSRIAKQQTTFSAGQADARTLVAEES